MMPWPLIIIMSQRMGKKKRFFIRITHADANSLISRNESVLFFRLRKMFGRGVELEGKVCTVVQFITSSEGVN